MLARFTGVTQYGQYDKHRAQIDLESTVNTVSLCTRDRKAAYRLDQARFMALVPDKIWRVLIRSHAWRLHTKEKRSESDICSNTSSVFAQDAFAQQVVEIHLRLPTFLRAC